VYEEKISSSAAENVQLQHYFALLEYLRKSYHR